MSAATAAIALRAATAELVAAGIENPAGDARRLLAHALKITPDRVTLALPDQISANAQAALNAAIAARLQRQPVAQILGVREFWGRSFKITAAVLDPRPETEILVKAALSQPFSRVLDLGTGSGCILLTLLCERAGAKGLGVDISPDALEIAAQNCLALGLQARVNLGVSDWFSAVEDSFDLIVANPPYIALAEMAALAPEVRRWEPMSALLAGPVGLEAYNDIAVDIRRYLAPAGRLLLEVGPQQAAQVTAIFGAVGLQQRAVHLDMDGRERVVELGNEQDT